MPLFNHDLSVLNDDEFVEIRLLDFSFELTALSLSFQKSLYKSPNAINSKYDLHNTVFNNKKKSCLFPILINDNACNAVISSVTPIENLFFLRNLQNSIIFF